MPTSETVKLLGQLQQAAEADAKALIDFHAGQLTDFEALLSQINEKVTDDRARTDAMLEQIEAVKTQVLDARKSSSEFLGKVTDWLEAAITSTRRRMEADAGQRQPAPVKAADVRPLGRVNRASIDAITSLAEKPAGHIGNGSTNGAAEPAAVN